MFRWGDINKYHYNNNHQLITELQIKMHYLLFFLLIFTYSPAFSSVYSLDKLLEIGEKNSENIKGAEYFADSQLYLAKQQKYWSNPNVGFENSKNSDNVIISQTVPFYNKLSNKYKIEESEYKILSIKKNETALLVKAEIFRLAYQYYGLQKKIKLFEKRISRLSSVDKYLSNIVLVSPTKNSQAYIVKDKINLLKRDLIKMQSSLYQIWNKMNIFLQLEEVPDVEIKFYAKKPFNQINQVEFIDKSIDQNLLLKQQKQAIEKYKAEISFAKIEQMPDLNISVTNSSLLSSGQGASAGSNKIGFSVPLPLINRNQQKIYALESRIKGLQANYKFEETQLINLVKNAINEYNALLEIEKKFPMNKIDNIIARLNSANSDFQKGILDFITYVEFDAQEYNIIEASIDTQIAIAEIYSKLMVQSGNFIIPQYE